MSEEREVGRRNSWVTPLTERTYQREMHAPMNVVYLNREDYREMGKKEERDELEDVESIPREQAEREMHEAARHAQEGGSRRGSRSGGQEEEEEVTPETRKQAKEELREAVEHVREEEE